MSSGPSTVPLHLESADQQTLSKLGMIFSLEKVTTSRLTFRTSHD